MPDGEARAAAEAVTRPLLESLGSRYRTHCEGVGLYTGQALLNHSCEPNVTLLKPAGDDEHDNRVVASLTVDAAAGEAPPPISSFVRAPGSVDGVSSHLQL